MNKLTSLKQISSYRPKALSLDTHNILNKQLNQFQINSDQSYLKAVYKFDKENYNKVVDKMTIIGQIADNMDHHP